MKYERLCCETFVEPMHEMNAALVEVSAERRETNGMLAVIAAGA